MLTTRDYGERGEHPKRGLGRLMTKAAGRVTILKVLQELCQGRRDENSQMAGVLGPKARMYGERGVEVVQAWKQCPTLHALLAMSLYMLS